MVDSHRKIDEDVMVRAIQEVQQDREGVGSVTINLVSIRIIL